MAKYTLEGVDGNAFSLIGYTSKALKREGLSHLVDEMTSKAMSGDYDNVIRTCLGYLEFANAAAGEA